MNQSNIAVNIDIQTELDAADRGECLLCRISSRHPDNSKCPRAPEINSFWNRYEQGVKFGPFVEDLMKKDLWNSIKALKEQQAELEQIRDYALPLMTKAEKDIALMDLYLVNCKITRLFPGDYCDCHHYGRPGWLLVNDSWIECPVCNSQYSLAG